MTGTPIQNYVEDLGALIGFLRAYPFDNLTKFRTTFVEPISNRDTEGYENLRRLIQATCLRRTKNMVIDKLGLPPREERTQLIQLDDRERRLYERVKKSSVLMIQPDGSVKSALQVILRLRQISNHGRELLPRELLGRIDQGAFGESLLLNTSTCEFCNEVTSIPEITEWTCMHQICSNCALRRDDDDDSANICPLCSADQQPTAVHSVRKKVDETSQNTYEPSSKIKALLQNLNKDREDARKSGKDIQKRLVIGIRGYSVLFTFANTTKCCILMLDKNARFG